MKIVVWNIDKINISKLANQFSPTFQAYGLGNNILDYVTRVVMGGDEWSGVISSEPPDLFVVIEMLTGGQTKNAAISGNCQLGLNAFRNAMNNYMQLMRPMEATDYVYNEVTPVIIGYRETMGFFYNTRSLGFNASGIQRNQLNNQYLNPKTPYSVRFNILNKPGQTITFTGVHAKPRSEFWNGGYPDPIDYCSNLHNIGAAGDPNGVMLGDFNCNPGESYVNGNGVRIFPFTGLTAMGYSTDLPTPTLSSSRNNVDNNYPQPANYMANAFDNAFTHFGVNILIQDEYRPDLVGDAVDQRDDSPLYPGRVVSTLNAFNRVSDHFPVILEISVH